MDKRGKGVICIFEISLIILMSFAIAFILESSLVSAQEVILPDVTSPTGFVNEFGEPISNTLVPNGAAPPVPNPPVPDPNTATGGGFKPFEFVQNILGGQAFGTPGTTAAGALTGKGLAVAWGNTLVGAAAWAGIAYVAGQLIGNLFGLEDGETDALSSGLAAGAGVFAALQFASQNGILGGVFQTGIVNFGIGTGIGVLVFVMTYKKEKKYVVSFECLPFEPPVGGHNCEECNKDPFRPCSEYRCKSLGQACSLENQGTSDEICIWKNPKDVTSPTITPWKLALKPEGLNYNPDNTIRPPHRGVKIVGSGSDGCLQAFTPLEFGITLNEPARCKIDYNMTKTYAEMTFAFGGSNLMDYNHSQTMKLPGPDSGDGEVTPVLENDGTFSLYARCKDANGNENVDAFAFSFCVDPSPDTTPPRITGTSIEDGSFVRYDIDEVPMEVYINEPSECRWSRQSKSYEDMENGMNCFTESYQINADLNYVCMGNLTGVEDRKDNTYYFRCKDQPGKPENERNVMTQSYVLTLKGTQPLNIVNVGPNGTISGSTERVEIELFVRTDDGAEEGKALCYFSSSGEQDSYVAMFESLSHEHRQQLFLPAGDYEYFFRCIDLGGNSAEESTSFSVLVDKQAPMITRAYKEDGLKIVTDENAECVYSLSSCNYVFDEGLAMIYSNPSFKQNHYAQWEDNKMYYIKCRDFKGNEPSPNECGIVVNSVELMSS